MDSKIVVDAVLIGKVENTVLHGISNVTGNFHFRLFTLGFLKTEFHIVFISYSLMMNSLFWGGCCFKPETSKVALQLFEMETVLSMELRKEKKKYDISSINHEV